VLRGIDVDIACYSEYLTRRDEKDMQPFYDFLDIQPGQVRYQTFEQLCASALAGVGAMATELMTTGQAAPSGTSGVLDEGRARVLLIDEVDVFFQRDFFGQTYNAGILLRGAEISSLVHHIFQQRNNLAFDVQESPEAQAVRKIFPRHPRMIPLLNSLFNELVEKSRKFGERTSLFDAKENTVKYKFRESFTSKVVFPNETMFQYLHHADAGEIAPADAEEHLGIDVHIARFSYAEIPKRNFCAVLGVTGTLRTVEKLEGTPDEYILDEDERKFLDRDFGIKTFTYTPSVFGGSKLEFAFRTDVAVLHDEPQWYNRLQEVADDVSKLQHAVIIFFDTCERLVQARKHLPQLTSAQLLHENTPASQVGPIVTAATQPGAILLSTATFGRGTNFFCADATVVVTVVQAFYSASLSEEVQIKGRTARQKHEGRFRLVLCSEHLAADFFLDEPDTDTGVTPTRLDNVKGRLQRAIDENRLEDLMKSQRALRMKKLNEGRDERVLAARQLHRKAEAMVSTVVKETDAQKQLTTLLEACQMEVVTSRLVVLVLDESGSMAGSPWTNLVVAYKDFMGTLRRAGDGTHVVVVGFACGASVHAEAPLENFNFDLPKSRITENGASTNFHAAFSVVESVICRDAFNAHSVSIVFLTDGCPNDDSHTAVVKSMLDRRAVREVFSIYFNRGETVPIAVKQLHEVFEQNQVRSVMSHARTNAELSIEMRAAASGAPMHRH